MINQEKIGARYELVYREFIRPHLPVIITGILYAIVAALSYAIVWNKAPRPFSPLNSITDWASWFDVLIAFPLLSILCAIPFRGMRSARIVVPVILISPLYLILYSFFLVYNLPSLGLLLLFIPVAELVPVALIASTYIVPLFLALVAAREIPRAPVKSKALPKLYFVVAAAVSLALVATDFSLRLLAFSSASSLISVVSDVGWAAQSGAVALMHGISPYSASLPPWNGSAPLSYGPMDFVLLIPFALLPISIGAHIASVFYALLAAFGIYLTVRTIRPSIAPIAALTFIALPVTFYDMSAAFTPHIMAASLIAWATYFYFTGKYRLSGLFIGLSGLTIGIPFALILPFVFPLKRSDRTRLLEGYVPVLTILLAGALVIFGEGSITSFNAFLGVVSFYGIGMYLTPLAESILEWIPAGALAIWFIYASSKGRSREDALRTGALFMLLLPFAVGYFFAFFFIWQGILLLIYIFIRMEVNDSWTSLSTDAL